MSVLLGIIEVALAITIYIILKPYIDTVINFLTVFIHPIFLTFILLAISVSIILFIISRKD